MAWECRVVLLSVLCILMVSSDGRKVSHVSRLGETTNSRDVQGLNVLMSQFPMLSLISAGDDPCLPTPWIWVECSSSTSPRVTALNLGVASLAGEIPSFSTMDALETIDMHGNILIGTIPSFLGTLPNLTVLNLANNFLSGYIPASILQNKKLATYVTGNFALVLSPPPKGQGGSTSPNPGLVEGDTIDPSIYTYQKPKGKKNSKLPAILGGSGSVIALISAAIGVFAIFRQKARTAAAVAQAQAQATAGTTMAKETGEEAPMNAATTPSHG